MRLRDLLDDQAELKREVLIGREIDVQSKKSLLLGLCETEEVEDGELESVCRLFVLHEEYEEDDEWDDEGWEDEEEQTNRQALIEAMDADDDVSVTDIDAMIINGIRYEINGISVSYLEEQPYEETILIKHFAAGDCIPSSWLEKDADMLALAAYDVDPEMFDVSWEADILNIVVEMLEPVEETLVGKVIPCRLGHYEVPKIFTIKGKDGEDIQVNIHGLYLHNIWTDFACLEMDFSELEEYCSRDERLLILEYSTDRDLVLDFYTKDYLDAPADEDEPGIPGFGVLTGSEHHEVAMLDVVPEDFDDEVEIELLSYTM